MGVFVVSGASGASATLDLARTMMRRAERETTGVQQLRGSVNPLVTTYLNRVSDVVYVLARWAAAGGEERRCQVTSKWSDPPQDVEYVLRASVTLRRRWSLRVR